MADNDLLDWTISDAPAELDAWPEPALLPPAPRARPSVQWRWALPRRAWLMLATVTLVAVLLAAFGLPWLERQRARHAVELVIAQEAALIAAGDWQALHVLYDPELSGWASDEIDAIRQGIPPALLQALAGWPPDPQARLRAVWVLDPKTARAEVVRSYQLRDGKVATLAMPQFYRYAENGWVHTEPPEAWWGAAHHYDGARVSVDYRAVDAVYAVELGRYLDGLVAQACQQWACPADLRVPVVVAHALPRYRINDWWYSGIGSLTFGLMSQSGGQAEHLPLPVLSPTLSGVPQDEATLAATRRPIGVRALVWVAQQSTGLTQPDELRPMLYALVVRQLARLGLEAPGLEHLDVASPLFSPEQLWSLPGVHSTHTPELGLRQALAVLNQLLAGQPLTAEAALFQTLPTAPDLTAWLAGGLGLSPPEAQARVAAALNPPVPLAGSRLGAPDLVLNCANGLRLASLDGRVWPLLRGNYPNSNVHSWSPDGRWLAVRIAGRLAVLDMAAGTGTWLPQPNAEFSNPAQWVGDSVLAYEAVSRTGNPEGYWPASDSVHFYDAADPARHLAPMDGATNYLLSPDGTQAVVNRGRPSAGSFLIPPLGGEAVSLELGFVQQPAWSPDSRHLAFVQQADTGGHWALQVVDTATGALRTLLAAGDPRLPAANQAAQSVWASVAWSPRGDELAVAVTAYDDFQPTTWLGLVSPDGADWQLLADPAPGTGLSSALYSADGRYLAVGQTQMYRPPKTLLYDRAAAWGRTLPGLYPTAWSPSGHSLALAGQAGTYLLASATDGTPERLPLAGEQCYQATWRPGRGAP